MIMTAELNSHQRVSYYTGVKLIRHHQSASTANPNNNNNNNTNNNNTSSSSNNNNASPGYYHHHNHYPPQPAPHHHHPSHHHPHPPPHLPSHHPGHFHLQCPTGPPHIQHPGGVLHLNNHHGGPQYHQHHNGHHHYGGGSNQATRLYTGSPLIRSTGYHSSTSAPGGPGGGAVIGSNKRAFKGHHNKNHHPHHNNHHHNGRNGVGNPNHHNHHQSIIGGSCSSGTSSSSSSNEHLNNLRSPAGSPVTQTKLDPLKLSSSANLNGESSHSSSNNSSPGPHGSPSPSTLSNVSSSSSPRSSDGNKDLDHFYFLDEHWKPANDRGSGIGLGEVMDISSNNNSVWTNYSSGSPSPPTVTSTTSSSLNMMVDQFFADNGSNTNNFGLVDVNNNSIGNGDHGMGGGVILRDLNNNVIGVQQPDLATRSGGNDRFHSSFSGVNCGNLNSGNGGASGLLNCGTTTKFNGSAAATTVVNVETQIGTFNGQRDLEIRLCFIKDDRQQAYHQQGNKLGGNQDQGLPSYPAEMRMSTDQDTKLITAIGDPFKPSHSSRLGQGEPKSPSASSTTSSDNEMDTSGGPAPVGIETPGNKEVVQQS